jgi:hypothetical protein
VDKCLQKRKQQPRHRNKGQQNYILGKVNHVTIESTQEALDVVFGTFLVNSNPASVLFDSRVSCSFISVDFMKKNTFD